MAYKKWTVEELTKLKVMWENNDIIDIANALGRTKRQVVQMAWTVRLDYPGSLPSKRATNDEAIKTVFG